MFRFLHVNYAKNHVIPNFKNYVQKCAMAKVFAFIFNQTIYKKTLMLRGTSGAFDFIENMLLYPKFTKRSDYAQWPRTNIKLSIKCIDVNCTQGKFLILNWFSSAYVFSTLCISFKSLETNVSYLEKKIFHSVQNSNAPKKVDYQTQHIHGIKETILTERGNMGETASAGHAITSMGENPKLLSLKSETYILHHGTAED